MRARGIKPQFFTDEVIIGLPFDARLLFIGLWCAADREGRLEDKPRQLKIDLFPEQKVDVAGGLQRLADAGLILRYRVADAGYIQVTHFAQHQSPHVKEAPSTIPAPDEPGASMVQARLISDSCSLTPDCGSLTVVKGACQARFDDETVDNLLSVAASVQSVKGSWTPSAADRRTLAALCERFPPQQLMGEMMKFKAYAAQRDWTAFGRAFASWMGRVDPLPFPPPKSDARAERMARAQAALDQGDDEGTAQAYCMPDEWAEIMFRRGGTA